MKVAVVSPKRDAYSETFIRAHVERLPSEVAEVIHLHGGHLPLWEDGARPLPPRSLHAGGRLLGELLGKPGPRAVSLLAGQLPLALRERALARYLRRNGVDVVLAEYGQTGVAMRPVAERANVPLVVHFHGWDAFHEAALEEYESRYRRLFRGVDGVVAGSENLVEQLIRLGATSDQIYRNPYGIDLDRFTPGTPGTVPPQFVAVGRFVEKKAPHVTLLAFGRVAQQFRESRLRMAGDGPLLDSCRSLAVALEIAHQVEFLGALPHEQVAELMQNARCFLQHSVTAPSGDSESTAISVREAMASGLPVVATRHAGILEAVVPGETGFLVDEHDWRTMATHMVGMVEDKELAAQLGKAGRRRAEKAFGMDESISKLAEILAEAAKQA